MYVVNDNGKQLLIQCQTSMGVTKLTLKLCMGEYQSAKTDSKPQQHK